jgi:hypothetical protein
MLHLKLRDEFLGSQTPGTVVSLRNSDNTGAAQQSPDRILSITYPTADVLAALRAVSEKRARRPIVLMGDRGRGKSHIMAVMHHAIQSPDQVEAWACEWGRRPGIEALHDLKLQPGFVAISEPVHNHEYPLLWDLLFDRHPRGDFYRGKFQQMDRPYPPRSLLEEMFEAQPVALILDEFQKWFDGLHDELGATGRKWRESASNFIQNLSEISRERPDILILAISVLNNETEAFRQVHRDSPVLIDFRGPTARRDRQRLLLHRLFKNRDNIPSDDIRRLIAAYASERFRLRFAHLPDSERDRIIAEVVECWPFSPELLELLDDHILMAAAAQETRDLIRILASVFRARGEEVPVLTPADFFVDDDACGVQSLLDSIVTAGEQEELRQIAQRNLEHIQTLGVPIPHARELVSALWMRSMSPLRIVGGTRQELQIDIARDTSPDDNAFRGELALLVDSCINIHGEERQDGRLYFGHGENPRTKVRSTAGNDKLWQPSLATGIVGQTVYPAKDIEHIRKTLLHLLVPETKQAASRVIVLGPQWEQDPWGEVDEADSPERWDRPVLIVIPASLETSTENGTARLGDWLKKHVPAGRNTVRFLLPAMGSSGIYEDRELLFSARCSYLTTIAWKDDPKYRALKEEFDRPLREALKARYDRFAVLRRWDYRNPQQCVFDVEKIEARGGDIPSAVEEKIVADLFDPAGFQKSVLNHAKNLKPVGELLKDLCEPPPSNTSDAIPYLGETALYEEILKVAATGKVVLNVGGTWIGRLPEHEDESTALTYLRSKAFRSGQEMRQVQLGLPSAVGGTTVTAPRPQPLEVTSPTPIPVVSPPRVPYSEGGIPASTFEEGAITPLEPASPPEVKPPKTLSTEEPATGINLSGCFERWGVPSGTTLSSAKVTFTDVSVQQLKQILQRLPSSFRASLEISYHEEES